MIDILKKYYEINVNEYTEYNEGIIFFVNGIYYYLVKCMYDEGTVEKAFDISLKVKNSNIKLHDFVFNKNGKIYSEGYVLFKINVLICNIDFNDIKEFNSFNGNEYKNDYVFMDRFWEDKIDYLEMQLTELSNNKLINNSFDYYVGIAEVLISYLKKNFSKEGVNLCLSHKCLNSLSSLDFYNPLNISFDIGLKDIASYIRLTNDKELFYTLLDKQDYNSYQYFFVRMTFPFNYFYEVGQVLLDGKSDKDLIRIVNNINNYEKYILDVEKSFGIYLFSWIKKE